MNASIAAFASRNARVDAIKPDTEPGLEKWLDINRQYSAVWPNITKKKPAPPETPL
jgi:hypothetical protein